MITVYHATNFNNELPYKKVASVKTVSFQHAYRLTNNVNESWAECSNNLVATKGWVNNEVKLECEAENGLRSTSSGDVMILDEGTDSELAFFLVPMGNGPRGNKSYDNHGDTEEIDNFDINGFMYNGNHKIYSKDGDLMATFKKPSIQEAS